MQKILGTIFLLIISGTCLAAVQYRSDFSGEFPHSGISVYLDKTKSLSVDEVLAINQFQPIIESEQSFGWLHANGWAKVEIYNPLDYAVEIVLEHSSIEGIQFFRWDQEGKPTRIADLRDNSYWDQVMASRYHAGLVELQPGMNIIIQQVVGTAIRFPLRLWEPRNFVIYNRKELLSHSLIFGAFAALFIYNLIVMFSTRSLPHIYNVVYLLAITVLNAVLSSYVNFFSLSWGETLLPYWIYSLGIACISYILFTRYLMQDLLNRFERAYLSFFCFYFLGFFLVLAFSRAYALQYFLLGLIGYWPVTLFVGLKNSIRGYKPATYYTIGWASIAVGGMTIIGVYGGMIPSTPITQQASVIGMLLDIIFRTLAHAEKIKYQENQALASALGNEAKNRHLLSQLKNLVYPHQVDIIQQNHTITETMPIATRHACVIAFDIQQSAEIGHSQHPEFFANVLKSCHAHMNTNYDKSKLSANAYMIKEMGDGFICSIGFPFSCENSVFEKAIELAHSFVQVLNAEAQRSFPERQIYCAMGIAYSTVSGFFPSAGLQYYELYGDAIVKAKRYEEFRKILKLHFELPSSNIMIIHHDVYSQLSQNIQERFTTIHLTDRRAIRDDPNANLAHIQCLDAAGQTINLSSMREKASA